MISNNLAISGSQFGNPSNTKPAGNVPAGGEGNLETRIIQRGGEATKDNVTSPSPANPENVNRAAGNAQDAVNNAQGNVQAQRDTNRERTVQAGAIQSQRNTIESYFGSYSGESSSSSSDNSLQALADITQRQNAETRIVNQQDLSEARPQNAGSGDRVVTIQTSTPQQQLGSSIENAVGAGPQSSSFQFKV
jgi:hypothetical protein